MPGTVIALIIVLGLLYRWYSRRNLAPGPPSIPILGCMPFTGWSFNVTAEYLLPRYYKYGDIVRFDCGLVSFHIINDYELAKKLFSMESCSGRIHSFDEIRSHCCKPKMARGIIANVGHSWTEQRRFSLKNLREFGYGRKGLEIIIQEEARLLVEQMLKECKSKGELLIENTFNLSVLNVLWQIVSSKRLDYADKETAEALDLVNRIFHKGFLGVFVIFPFLTKVLPPKTYGAKVIRVMEVLRKEVIEHEKMFDPDAPAKDFIDVYLKEIEKGENSDFHREQLVNLCWDFFAAGSETTSTYLKWCAMYMAIHQDVQQKCREEINEIIGEKMVEKDDQAKLPYVNATMQEIFRLAHVAPTSLAHMAEEDVLIKDFIIPKGSYMNCNLIKFSMDPEIFPNPTEFNPMRFIEDNKLKTYKQLAPFGIGKRICMGESLGRTSGFIFFVTMLQHMKMSPALGRPKLNPNNFVRNLTSIPNPFYINLERAQ